MPVMTWRFYETSLAEIQATGRLCNITSLECKFEEKISAEIFISGSELSLPLYRIHRTWIMKHTMSNHRKRSRLF
jgi:hypothetical protein